MDERWTLADLVSEAETRIAALPAPKNGQIRAVPDERTIRYYGTLGLLDRPIAMRGRTALYGRRHLAQVVAIKRLQTTGSSLAEIQALWPTLDDGTLTRMSGIAITAAPEAAKKGRADFWKSPEEFKPPPPPIADRPVPPPERPAPQPTPQPRAASAGLEQSRMELADAVHEEMLQNPILDEEHDLDERQLEAKTEPPDDAPPPEPTRPAAAALEVQIEVAPGIRIAIAVPDGGITFTPDDVRAIRAAAVPLVELTRRRLAEQPTEDRTPRKKTNEGAGR